MRLLRRGIGRTRGYPPSPSHSSQPSQTQPRQQLPFSGCIKKCRPNSIPHSQIAKLVPSKMRSLSRFAGDSSQSLFAISGRQHNAVAFCELRGLIRGSTWRLLLRFAEVYRDCVRRSLVLLRSRCALCGSRRGRCS